MTRNWQRGEITAFVVLGILALIGVATFLNTSLNKQPQTVETHAQSCNFDSGQAVPLGSTETNTGNMENRWPISANRHEYDFFSYFVPATLAEAQSSGMPVLSQNAYLTFQDAPSGATDAKAAGMLGKMFGYKPNQLADAYFMKYKDSALQGADTLVKGTAPALKVPITPGDPVVMPDTQYDIGGGKEAMVVFAAADRVTLHISRAEYIRGSGANNCNGGPCSGGYWIYIRGICVDQQIQNAYNSTKAGQEAAGANKTPIQLPEIAPGRILGKAASSSVEVIVRDNGPLISIHKPFYWQGVPTKNFAAPTPTLPLVTSTPTPPAGATATPLPTVPPGTTATPTPTWYPELIPTATPTPLASQCGNNGQRCCNPTDPVPAGTVCYGLLLCTSNICLPPTTPTSVPTATLTPTPTTLVTWTPTPPPSGPTPVRPLCKNLEINGLAAEKYDLVFLSSGYTDYESFQTDATEIMEAFKKTNLGPLLNKFNYRINTTMGNLPNVAHCSNGFPCWDTALAMRVANDCDGDGYIIIINTPKPEENVDLAAQSAASWGSSGGLTNRVGNVAVLRYSLLAGIHELGHSIAELHDEYVTNRIANITFRPPLNCSKEPSSSGVETEACPRWKADFPGVGCYTGCYYKDWYRAEKDSIMTGAFDTYKYTRPGLKMWETALSKFK